MIKKLFYSNTLRLVLLFVLLTAAGLFHWTAVNGIKVSYIWYGAEIIISLALIAVYRKSVSIKDVLIGLLFGLMCVPRAMPKYPSATSVYMFGIYFDKSYIPFIVSVIPAYIASMAVFKNSDNKIYLFKNGKKHILLKSVLCIVLAGGITGALDCVISVLSGKNPVFNFNSVCVAIGLETGFFEEVFFRMFLFALCALITRNAKLTKLQNILCYAIMVLPHTLVHYTPHMAIHYPLEVLYMAAVRILPMAIAQRRLNLVSAVGIHALHNIIIYTVLGML